MKYRIGLLWAVSLVLLVSLEAKGWAAKYDYEDLGTLGGTDSEAYAVNGKGQVVGTSYYNNITNHAFLWTLGKGMEDLGSLMEGRSSVAYGINDLGQVVGFAEIVFDGNYRNRAFLWTPEKGMQDLGCGDDSYANGINNAGLVVGSFRTSKGFQNAFLWTAEGGKQELGTLGGEYSAANGINDAGLVVGSSTNADYKQRAFLWSPGPPAKMEDLGDLGGGESAAAAINASGQVVGSAKTTQGEWHAFWWSRDQGMQDLGVLTVGTIKRSSAALAVNDQGQVVGGSTSHAFIWTKKTGILDLTGLVVNLPPGTESWGAVGINQSGVIVGTNNFDFSHHGAYRLLPLAFSPGLSLLLD
jgi:probable HAF family extracellular repeat protein